MTASGNSPDTVRLSGRVDDLSARLDRTEERNEYVSRLTCQKLDEIEHQLSQVQSLLGRLGAQMEAAQVHFDRQWEKLTELQATHDRMLRGHEGQTGLLLRTDRIEQHVATSRWALRAILIALLTLSGTVIAEWIGR